jgi:hypothetical protein
VRSLNLMQGVRDEAGRLARTIWAPEWFLDHATGESNGYGISSSPDLIRWSTEESVSLPPDARHGSVARLTASEAAALRSSFPTRMIEAKPASV